MERKKSQQERFAEVLDDRFTIPGTDIRFGIDPLIGLLPGIGDWIGGVLSLYFPVYATMIGGKASILLRMFVNILADVVIGTIPLLGEIFDVAWKANIRNAELLDELEQNPDELATKSKLLLWGLLVLFVLVVFAVLWLISWILAQIVGAVL